MHNKYVEIKKKLEKTLVILVFVKKVCMSVCKRARKTDGQREKVRGKEDKEGGGRGRTEQE